MLKSCLVAENKFSHIQKLFQPLCYVSRSVPEVKKKWKREEVKNRFWTWQKWTPNKSYFLRNCLLLFLFYFPLFLTLYAPNPQYGLTTRSNNSSTVANDLFECVWPFCGVGVWRVKWLLMLTMLSTKSYLWFLPVQYWLLINYLLMVFHQKLVL